MYFFQLGVGGFLQFMGYKFGITQVVACAVPAGLYIAGKHGRVSLFAGKLIV